MTSDDYGPVGPGQGMGRWEREDMWMDMHDGWGMGWGGWFVMGLFVLLLIALIAAVVFLLLRGRGRTWSGGTSSGSAPSTAEQVLDERFARGEIEEQEYLHRRTVLRGK